MNNDKFLSFNYTRVCAEIQNEIDTEKEKKSVEEFHTILNEKDIDLFY
jgi:hypothetical protein